MKKILLLLSIALLGASFSTFADEDSMEDHREEMEAHKEACQEKIDAAENEEERKEIRNGCYKETQKLRRSARTEAREVKKEHREMRMGEKE